MNPEPDVNSCGYRLTGKPMAIDATTKSVVLLVSRLTVRGVKSVVVQSYVVSRIGLSGDPINEGGAWSWATIAPETTFASDHAGCSGEWASEYEDGIRKSTVPGRQIVIG